MLNINVQSSYFPVEEDNQKERKLRKVKPDFLKTIVGCLESKIPGKEKELSFSILKEN